LIVTDEILIKEYIFTII